MPGRTDRASSPGVERRIERPARASAMNGSTAGRRRGDPANVGQAPEDRGTDRRRGASRSGTPTLDRSARCPGRSRTGHRLGHVRAEPTVRPDGPTEKPSSSSAGLTRSTARLCGPNDAALSRVARRARALLPHHVRADRTGFEDRIAGEPAATEHARQCLLEQSARRQSSLGSRYQSVGLIAARSGCRTTSRPGTTSLPMAGHGAGSRTSAE